MKERQPLNEAQRAAQTIWWELIRTLRVNRTADWLTARLPDGKPGPYLFGWWASPWSGDENDPTPRRYWLWYRLYRWTRTAEHWIDWHDWRTVGVVVRQRHCDWCGASRPLPWWAQKPEPPS